MKQKPPNAKLPPRPRTAASRTPRKSKPTQRRNQRPPVKRGAGQKLASATVRRMERTANEAKARPAAEVGPQAFTLPWPLETDNHRLMPIRMGKVTRMVLSKKARIYLAAAHDAARNAGVRLVSGPLSLTVSLYRPKKVGDATAWIKSLMDAMTGAVYVDDGQVVQLFLFKRDDAGNPRVEVVVEAAG